MSRSDNPGARRPARAGKSPNTPGLPIDLAKTVGDRLRTIRKEQKITLVELAKASGVDSATISRIETGQMTGTLESHIKLSRALGVKVTQLYAGIEDAQARSIVSSQTAGGRSEVYVHEAGKSAMALLTADVLKKKLMPMLVTIEPAGSTNREEARVGTEKFVYVLEGAVNVRLGEDVHQLKKGSTLYFEASVPHVVENPTTKVARYLAVTTPPAL
jgi:transcriptional regulator with XRE-family HTH domain